MKAKGAFDPADPFPLLEAAWSAEEARAHARAVDAWLGLRIVEVEARLAARQAAKQAKAAGHEIWWERGADVFLTPYVEFRQMLHVSRFPAGGCAVDLGAGYGRLGFVLAAVDPTAAFLGFELVPERTEEANRALAGRGAVQARVEAADVAAATFAMPSADLYFIYDFGSRPAIERALQALQGVARARAIAVIGRGRASRDAIERGHPWLSQVVAPLHFESWSLYRSAAATSAPSLCSDSE